MLDGTLYGTTDEGPAHGMVYEQTIFSLTPDGVETVVHAFSAPAGGLDPYAGVTVGKGSLYGSTSEQGPNGYGTIFSLQL